MGAFNTCSPELASTLESVPGFGRRPLVIALACLGAGLIGYELLPRDERQIASLLSEFCSKLNQTRDPRSLAELREFMATALKPQVRVHAEELPSDIEGLPGAREEAEELLRGPPLGFALSSVQIHVSGKLARVDADLLVTLSGSGEQRRDVRRTRVRLVKAAKPDAAWQIEAVEIDAIVPSEPEARP